jgi:hypothetical protein
MIKGLLSTFNQQWWSYGQSGGLLSGLISGLIEGVPPQELQDALVHTFMSFK